ncbi:LOW QUALITY PROTEIN: hypothetical protein MAR_001814, partial [Mya arenaria]
EQKVQIAFQFSSDRVSDFIQRFLKQNDDAQLKTDLQNRCGELRDVQIKFSELSKIRQLPDENVQKVSERIIALAEEA